jgi:hypothetical protein
MSPAHKTLAIIIALSVLVSGCVFYPKKIEYYTECDIKAKKLVLETEAMKGACSANSGDSDGKACLGGLIAMGAASAIISGSIVVVGNTVYWLEKEGKCLVKPKA